MTTAVYNAEWTVGPQKGSQIDKLTLAWSRFIPVQPTAKQLAFLFLPTLEALFGGAAGPGKSVGLLMSGLQYVDNPHYAALLLRKSYADLSLPGALMDKAAQWLGGTAAVWQAEKKTWAFPSGATLTFGYLDNTQDKYRYQSSEFQFCVGKGTPVLMGDGQWRAIEEIAPGEYVQTLEGPQPVLKVHRPGLKQVCRVSCSLGEVIVSAQHRLLTAFGGWCTPMELLSSQSPPCGNIDEYSWQRCGEGPVHLGHSPWGHWPIHAPWRQSAVGTVLLGSASSGVDGHSDCVASGDAHAVVGQRRISCAPLVLYARRPQSGAQGASCGGVPDAFPLVALQDSPIGCPMGLHSCGVHPLTHRVTGLGGTRQPDDAGARSQTCRNEGGRGNTLVCNPLEYVHPYTMERRPIRDADVRGLHCDMALAGEAEVFDLTVSSCSHYIIYPGLIASNCGFDELTQFQESDYRYMFSRLRRLEGSDIPIRMRAASNPGNIGHVWVQQRFMVERNDDRVFLPARIEDNPYLDRAEYEKTLQELDPITRLQLLNGDWSARQSGNKFRREWFEIVDEAPIDCRWVRRWDMAATEPKRGSDPDYTAGCLMGVSSKRVLYIADIKRLRGTPGACEALVRQTAETDGRNVAVRMEQEPGSSGVKVIDDYTRRVLMGWDFQGVPSTGNKEVRANPLASQAEAGNIKLVRGPWINAFLDEIELFPLGSHDDQVDAASGALLDLTSEPEVSIGWI